MVRQASSEVDSGDQHTRVILSRLAHEAREAIAMLWHPRLLSTVLRWTT